MKHWQMFIGLAVIAEITAYLEDIQAVVLLVALFIFCELDNAIEINALKGEIHELQSEQNKIV